MPRKKKSADELPDISGIWYNPEKPGFGVFVHNVGDQHTCAIYTYTENGRQLWLTGVASRSELDFKLRAGSGAGGFETLRNFVNVDAGTISFEIDGDRLVYTAVINSEIALPDYQFSPPPPPTFSYDGALAKLG